MERDTDALDWVQYDITATPYHLRRGDAAVIGVGGGRDILSAIWGGSRSVTGIEINGNLLNALQGPYRTFAAIADRPEVSLIHGEARSVLSRTDRRYDILQMSLIDTWAATGAGAFTLTENGLYTVEGWRVFLNTLAPGGIFSVSRWFAPIDRLRDDAPAGARGGVPPRSRCHASRRAFDHDGQSADRDAARLERTFHRRGS